MKINVYENQIRISTNNYINKYNNTKINKPSFKDNLNISKEGDALVHTLNIVKQTPDIRMEKVEDIKERIKNGTYNVSNEDFAEKILN